ncbi:bifunctional nuclease family protein [soil metagenome]|jgi:bifunctional DNase/RNase
MIETTVESIRVSLVTQQRVVILKESDGDRHLPIWIGAYEAEAIAMELQDVTPTRPLPYDLMRTLLVDLNVSVEQIVIADLNDQVFFARILLAKPDGETLEIDSRPSDAIALAVRTGSRIFVEESVMAGAGVTLEDDDDTAALSATASSGDVEEFGEGSRDPEASDSAPTATDDQLNVFRDFINSLDLDDFGKKKPK